MKSIFISSTFKDMQAERDLLQRKVFPRLRKALAEYGEDVNFLDLRWGVDTLNLDEDESGKLVLKVCIDSIDRCIPFVIVFLGERYGWIPSRHIIDVTNDTRIEEIYEEGMSVTNLEIQYGAFGKSQNLDRCIFCIRDAAFLRDIDEPYKAIYESESPAHKEKLDLLKARIRADKDITLVKYDCRWDADNHTVAGLEELEEQLYQELLDKILVEVKKEPIKNQYEKMKLEMELIQKQHLATYVPRYYDEYKIIWHILKGIRWLQMKDNYHVKAKGGSGKTALISSVARICAERDINTILYYCANASYQSEETFKAYLAYRIEELFQIPHREQLKNLDDYLIELNTIAAEKEPILCIVDGIDQMYPGQKEIFFSSLSLCPAICFVITSLDDVHVLGRIEKVLHMQELIPQQVRSIVTGTSLLHGKKMDVHTLQKILEKENSANPLYVTSLLQRLFMLSGEDFEQAEKMGIGIEGISRYMAQLLDTIPDDKEEMSKYLIATAIELFAHPQFKDIVNLLALSKEGLSENELREIFEYHQEEFNPLLFSQLTSFLYDVFVMKENGKWGFKHRLFLEAALEECKPRQREMLCSYALANPEFLRREGYVYLFREKRPEAYICIQKQREIQNLGEYITSLLKDETYVSYFLEIMNQCDADECYQLFKQVRENEVFLEKLYEREDLSLTLKVDYISSLASQNVLNEKVLEECIQKTSMLPQESSLVKNELLYQKGLLHYRKREYAIAKGYFEACYHYYEENVALERELRFGKLLELSKFVFECQYATRETTSDICENFYGLLKEETYEESSVLYKYEIKALWHAAMSYLQFEKYTPQKRLEYVKRVTEMAEALAKKEGSVASYELIIDILWDMTFYTAASRRYTISRTMVQYAEKLYELTKLLKHEKELARFYEKLAVDYFEAHALTYYDNRYKTEENLYKNANETYVKAIAAYEKLNSPSDVVAEKILQCNMQIKEGYYSPVHEMERLVETKEFSEYGRIFQYRSYEMILKAILMNRNDTLEKDLHEARSEQELLEASLLYGKRYFEMVQGDPKEKNRRLYLFRAGLYLALCHFERYEDELSLEYLGQTLLAMENMPNTHECKAMKALAYYLQALLLLEKGENVDAQLAYLEIHCKNYPSYSHDGIHDSNSRMYKTFPSYKAIKEGMNIRNVGEEFRMIIGSGWSVRVRKMHEEITIQNAIKILQKDSFIGNRTSNRTGKYPAYSDHFITYLNKVVNKHGFAEDCFELELSAHYAVTDSRVDLFSHTKTLARHWYKINYFDLALRYYAQVEPSEIEAEDEAAMYLSKCMMSYYRGENVELLAQMPGLTEHSERIYTVLKLVYFDNKLSTLLELNELLPKAAPGAMNFLYVITMKCMVEFGLLEQMSKEQLLLLKSKFMKNIQVRKEGAIRMLNEMPYEYEAVYHNFFIQNPYAYYAMCVEKQYAKRLVEYGELREALDYYERAEEYFESRDAETYSEQEMDLFIEVVEGLGKTYKANRYGKLAELKGLPELVKARYRSKMDRQEVDLVVEMLAHSNCGLNGQRPMITHLYMDLIAEGHDFYQELYQYAITVGVERNETVEFYTLFDLVDDLAKVDFPKNLREDISVKLEKFAMTDIDSHITERLDMNQKSRAAVLERKIDTTNE